MQFAQKGQWQIYKYILINKLHLISHNNKQHLAAALLPLTHKRLQKGFREN